MKRFSQFLGRFDLTNPQTAEDALLSLFETRRELVDDLEFEGEYCSVILGRNKNLTEWSLSAEQKPSGRP